MLCFIHRDLKWNVNFSLIKEESLDSCALHIYIYYFLPTWDSGMDQWNDQILCRISCVLQFVLSRCDLSHRRRSANWLRAWWKGIPNHLCSLTNNKSGLGCFRFHEFIRCPSVVLQRFAKVQVKWEDQLLDTWHKLEQHFVCFRLPTLCCHAAANGRTA